MFRYVKCDTGSYDYFETENEIYSTRNGKYYVHLKEWDNNPSLKYYKAEISLREYTKAWRTKDKIEL